MRDQKINGKVANSDAAETAAEDRCRTQEPAATATDNC